MRTLASAFLIAVCVAVIPLPASAQGFYPKEIINAPGAYKGPGKGSMSGIAKNDILNIIDFRALQEIVNKDGVQVASDTKAANAAINTSKK